MAMNIWFVAAIILGFVANIMSSKAAKKLAEERLTLPYYALPDIIHDTFPAIPFDAPDVFLVGCLGYFLYMYYYDKLLLVEYNVICAWICGVIRSGFVCITILPTCMPYERAMAQPSWHKYIMATQTHDLMFSGHTIFFIAIGKSLQMPFIYILGPILLIIARQHYTIDVLVACLIWYFVSNEMLSATL